jgi:hypothetical protein
LEPKFGSNFFFFDKPPLFQTKKFWFLKKYKPEGVSDQNLVPKNYRDARGGLEPNFGFETGGVSRKKKSDERKTAEG